MLRIQNSIIDIERIFTDGFTLEQGDYQFCFLFSKIQEQQTQIQAQQQQIQQEKEKNENQQIILNDLIARITALERK